VSSKTDDGLKREEEKDRERESKFQKDYIFSCGDCFGKERSADVRKLICNTHRITMV
jgi:hypothetical protein